MTEQQRVEDIRREANERLTSFEVKQECDTPGHECWLCKDPRDPNMWFRVQLCPDTLVYTGDGGDFVFVRYSTPNGMLGWFNRNEDYVKQKLRAGDADEFHADYAEEWLKDQIDDQESLWKEYGDVGYREKRDGLEEILDCGMHSDAYGECEFYEKVLEVDNDFCELLPVRRLTGRFIWCIEAINWLRERVLGGLKYTRRGVSPLLNLDEQNDDFGDWIFDLDDAEFVALLAKQGTTVDE